MNNETDQLERILKTMKTETGAVPTAAFRTNAKIRILNTIAPSLSPLVAPIAPRKTNFFASMFRTALVVTLLGGTAVYAADSSIPNQPLYPVKILGEHIALVLAPTQPVRTTIANTIISHRIEEAEQAKQNENTHVYDETVTNFVRDAKKIDEIKNISHDVINATMEKHKDAIEEIKKENTKRHNRKKDADQSSDQKSSNENTQVQSSISAETATPTPTPQTNTTSEESSINVKGIFTETNIRFHR